MPIIVFGHRLASVTGSSRLRSDPLLTMDKYERIDERPWGMFYRNPMVGAKCSYQNLEL